MVRFHVLYLGASICKQEEFAKCVTILDVKEVIHRVKDFDIYSQVLTAANVMLLDNIKLESLAPSEVVTGDNRQGALPESIQLGLVLAQGKCILDISIFLGPQSQQIELMVPTSINNKQLEILILKQESHQRSSSVSVNLYKRLTLSYNKKELPDDAFLFQAFQNQKRPPNLVGINKIVPAKANAKPVSLASF